MSSTVSQQVKLCFSFYLFCKREMPFGNNNWFRVLSPCFKSKWWTEERWRMQNDIKCSNKLTTIYVSYKMKEKKTTKRHNLWKFCKKIRNDKVSREIKLFTDILYQNNYFNICGFLLINFFFIFLSCKNRSRKSCFIFHLAPQLEYFMTINEWNE